SSLSHTADHAYLHPFPTRRSSDLAIIIGAGLAGANLAWNLYSRGWQVRIYDQDGIASGASGNPQGALYAKLGVEYTPQTRLQIRSEEHTSELQSREKLVCRLLLEK